MLYTKIFLALGIPWIFESLHLHYLTHPHIENNECFSATEIFYKITECLYFTRGVFIFIIFICKRTVWSRLKKTFPFTKLGRGVEMRQIMQSRGRGGVNTGAGAGGDGISLSEVKSSQQTISSMVNVSQL